jgi:hypothetical protein
MLKVTLLKPIPSILLSKEISYYHFISYRQITINGFYLIENSPITVPDQYIEDNLVKSLMSKGFLAVEKIEEQSQEIQPQIETTFIEPPVEPVAENISKTIVQPVQEEDTNKTTEIQMSEKKQRRRTKQVNSE